jgi:hypothetical protein
MSRDFKSNNNFQSIEERVYYRYKWDTEAYTENDGLGEVCIKDTLFVESLHYGVIDHDNNSIIPNEEYLVSTRSGRVFDFVADSYSLMQLNFRTALERGIVSNAGSSFGNLQMLSSYSNPRLKYGRYLQSIFQFYNKTYIPNTLGITSIASYEDYVKNFFNFFLKELSSTPLTLTKWNTSLNSSILDTGLSFSYADISYSDDQKKIDQIIDHPCFEYVKNLALNMSFSIVHNNPNIMLYDLNSPAGASIRNSYSLYNLSSIFNKRYIKTYSLDNNELYNNINISYNKYVFENSLTKHVYVKCGKTVSEYFSLEPVSLTNRPYTDLEEVWYYTQIRNVEEGNVFKTQTLDNIFKKAKYFYKKLDKESAIGYINSMFRDQVWNKNNGYHDLKAKLEGRTQTEAQRQQTGGSPSSGGSSY